MTGIEAFSVLLLMARETKDFFFDLMMILGPRPDEMCQNYHYFRVKPSVARSNLGNL
jgi:hypothetical protein